MNEDNLANVDVAKYKVVSFDIFDTLLIRPFVKPSDVFRFIGNKYGAKHFRFHRSLFPVKAFIHGRGLNANIEDYYSFSGKKLKGFKEIETETELSLLRANPKVQPFFERCKALGIKIIATSDMYLPSDFLREALEKNGITGISEIFVSCECKATKRKGNLFDFVYDRLMTTVKDLKRSEVLHIGDNRRADFINARKRGFDSICVSKLTDDLFKTDKTYRRLYRLSGKNLAASSSSAIAARKKFGGVDAIQREIGYKIHGLYALSYSAFVARVIKKRKIDCALLVARDGFLLVDPLKELLGDSVCIKYTYIPRKQFYHTNYSGQLTDFSNRFVMAHSYRRELFKDLFAHFGLDFSPTVKSYRKHREELEALMKIEREKIHYKGYIESQLAGSRRACLVDCFSYHMTGLNYIESETGRTDIIGIYLDTTPSWLYRYFRKYEVEKRFPFAIFGWQLPIAEIIFTSPNPSASGVDGDGNVTFSKSPEMQNFTHNNEIAHDEALSFSKDLHDIFGEDLIWMFDNKRTFTTLSITLDIFDRKKFKTIENLFSKYIDTFITDENGNRIG